jgi:hypothetical protein
MKRRSVLGSMHVTGLILAVLLWAGGLARADQYYTATYSYDYSIQVGITYTGQTSTQYTSPVLFNVTPTNPAGSPFLGFCIDLWHDEYSPTNFKATTTTNNFQSAVVPSGVTPTVTDPQLTNELNYLGTIFSAINHSNNDEMGALQLAVWHLIDSNFQVTSWPSDTTLEKDYKAITGYNGTTYSGGLLGGVATSSITGSSISGYNKNLLYSSAQVLVLDQSYQAGQNVITWSGGITTQSITPEPSTFAIGALGALAFIGYGLRRRSKA